MILVLPFLTELNHQLLGISIVGGVQTVVAPTAGILNKRLA